LEEAISCRNGIKKKKGHKAFLRRRAGRESITSPRSNVPRDHTKGEKIIKKVGGKKRAW